jgi:hypothetical protein
MMKKLAAVIAAAISAGLIVTFMPGFAPEVAAGATPSVEQSAPSSATPATPATTIRRHPKITCEQSWPYYGPSCLRDGDQTNSARVVRVIAADRSAAARPQRR